MSTATGSGLLHAFVLDGKSSTELDWDAIARWTPDAGVLWLTLDYSMPDAQEWLEQRSGIEPLIREALLDHDPRPRAVAYGEDLLVIIRGINQNLGAEPEDMVSVRVFVQPKRIITLRHRVSRSLESLAVEVGAGRGPHDVSELLAELVERMVEHAVGRVDTLADAIAEDEDEVLVSTRGELRGKLADHRRRAIALRRFLSPQREALAKLSAVPTPWLHARFRERVAEAADRMTRTVEELDASRDRAAVTQEELASRLTEMTNQRLYVLSIITAVFLPLGFVCGLLGVNVGGVPLQKAEWAFWALCGMFVVGVAIQVWLFRRRGWL